MSKKSYTIAASERRKKKIRILNPMPGGSPYTSEERAERFVRNNRGYLDSCGHLVFYGESAGKTRPGMPPVLKSFSGVDAFPDRAVFPPSGEVLQRMSPTRIPLRPPVRTEA
jgi:hypothetical protein